MAGAGKHFGIASGGDGERGLARASRALTSLGLGICVCLMALLLFLSLTHTAHYLVLRWEQISVSLPSTAGDVLYHVLVAVAACALVGLGYAAWRLSPRIDERVLLAVAVVFSAAVGLCWCLLLGTEHNEFPDSMRLLAYAREAAAGDWSSFTDSAAVTALADIPDDAHLYFTMYPYQSGAFWYFYLVCRAFPQSPALALQVINVIADEATLLLVTWTARRFLEGRGARVLLSLALMASVPFFLSAGLPYGNSVGLAFGCAYLALQARAITMGVPDRRSRARRVALIVASAVPFAVMVVIKSTFVLFGIAALIAWGLKTLRERCLVALVAGVAAVLLGQALGGVPTAALEGRVGIDFGEGMPKTSWMVIGLDRSELTGAAGWWDTEAYRIMLEADGDMGEQKRLAGEELSRTLSGFLSDPAGALSFFVDKLVSEWCEPTFASLYYSNLSIGADGEPFDPYAIFGTTLPTDLESAGDVLVPKRLILFPDAVQSALYLGALLGLVSLLRSRRRNDAAVLLAVVFFAGFGCYLLWEAKSVYILPFFLLLSPLAALGLDDLYRRAGARRARAFKGGGEADD